MSATIHLDLTQQSVRATLSYSPSARILASLRSRKKSKEKATPPNGTNVELQNNFVSVHINSNDLHLSKSPWSKVSEAVGSAFTALSTSNPIACKGARVTVSAGMHQCGFTVAALNSSGTNALSRENIQRVAEAIIFENYGKEAIDQEIRWQLQGDNVHICVMSIPKSLIMSLAEACLNHQFKLKSITPAICSALALESKISRRTKSAITLAWEERTNPNKYHLTIFVRIIKGCAAYAWSARLPPALTLDDFEMNAEKALDRFMTASLCEPSERVVKVKWPSMDLEETTFLAEEAAL